MTAHCRITPGEVPEPLPQPGRIGDAFRGRFLDRCSMVEQWATNILEAAGDKARSICFFGKKLEAVRGLAGAEPSRLKTPERVLDLLDRFKPFAELRTCLAHSILTTARTDDGTCLAIFTPVRGSTNDHRCVVLSEEDMARLSGELARIAKEFTDQRLKSVSPSSPPPPKPAAAAGP